MRRIPVFFGILAICGLLISPMLFTISARAAGGSSGSSTTNHCGAEYLATWNGISGRVKACDNSVGYKVENGVVLPWDVSDQINGFLSDDYKSWAQIGYIKGYKLDPNGNLHLFIECWFPATQKYWSPYLSGSYNTLLQIITPNSWHTLEIRCWPQKGYDAVVFSMDGKIIKICNIGSNYPVLRRLQGVCEISTTSATMMGEWQSMQYILRTGRQGSTYLYYNWPSSTPFYDYNPYPYPPYHCVIDSQNSFHNVAGW